MVDDSAAGASGSRPKASAGETGGSGKGGSNSRRRGRRKKSAPTEAARAASSSGKAGGAQGEASSGREEGKAGSPRRSASRRRGRSRGGNTRGGEESRGGDAKPPETQSSDAPRSQRSRSEGRGKAPSSRGGRGGRKPSRPRRGSAVEAAPPPPQPVSAEFELDAAGKRRRRRRRRRGKGDGDSAQPEAQEAVQGNALDLGLDVKSFLNLSNGEAGRLVGSGIKSLYDLFFHLPVAYQDRRKITSSKRAAPGVDGVMIGTLSRRRIRLHTAGEAQERLAILEFTDSVGTFLAAYPLSAEGVHVRHLKVGQAFVVSGQIIEFKGDAVVVEPKLEPIDPNIPALLQRGGIVPRYGELAEMTDLELSHLVYRALIKAQGRLPAVLPYPDVPSLEESLWALHFPTADADLDALTRRQTLHHDVLLEAELFLYGLAIALRRAQRDPATTRLEVKHALVARFIKALPYTLTPDQAAAFEDIKRDIRGNQPMGRLLQADTGTGKIAVGMLAALLAIENSQQVAFIVPTDLMAERRYRAMAHTLDRMGVQVAVLSSSVRGSDREAVLQRLRKGDIQLIIGTRALFQDSVQFRRLGLVVLEEQHFGGIQPEMPTNKSRRVRPHLLVLTTIPIPTTVAYLQFGDLDVSRLTTRPEGFGQVETHVLQDMHRPEAFEIYREILGTRLQGVVLHNRALKDEGKVRLREELVAAGFAEDRIGILPDVSLPEERATIVSGFKSRQFQLLMLPLGEEELVDLRNACSVLVDGAEGCSLSYLNRLRVMAERGPGDGGAIFVVSGPTAEAELKRLGALAQADDGFELADADLRHRGLQAFIGGRTSNLPTFKVVDLSRHLADLPPILKDVETWVQSNPGWHGDAAFNHLTALLRSRWGTLISGKPKK